MAAAMAAAAINGLLLLHRRQPSSPSAPTISAAAEHVPKSSDTMLSLLIFQIATDRIHHLLAAAAHLLPRDRRRLPPFFPTNSTAAAIKNRCPLPNSFSPGQPHPTAAAATSTPQLAGGPVTVVAPAEPISKNQMKRTHCCCQHQWQKTRAMCGPFIKPNETIAVVNKFSSPHSHLHGCPSTIVKIDHCPIKIENPSSLVVDSNVSPPCRSSAGHLICQQISHPNRNGPCCHPIHFRCPLPSDNFSARRN